MLCVNDAIRPLVVPALERLELEGPNRLLADNAVLFNARATMDNGSTQELPPER
jgi:hypothetical protein